MASVVWMGVFMLLMAELVIVAFLVLPLPRMVRKFIARKIFTYDLGRRVRFISNFIILGLIVSVADAIQTLRHLEYKETDDSNKAATGYPNERAGYITTSYDKQRKFRAERNMYLAGFALTLMFCIARIVELMQATVNAEDETEIVKKRLAVSETRAANSTSTSVLEDSSMADDENTQPPGEPGSTPFVLRRRNVSADGDNAAKED